MLSTYGWTIWGHGVRWWLPHVRIVSHVVAIGLQETHSTTQHWWKSTRSSTTQHTHLTSAQITHLLSLSLTQLRRKSWHFNLEKKKNQWWNELWLMMRWWSKEHAGTNQCRSSCIHNVVDELPDVLSAKGYETKITHVHRSQVATDSQWQPHSLLHHILKGCLHLCFSVRWSNLIYTLKKWVFQNFSHTLSK